MTQPDELKPCPFCGGQAETVAYQCSEDCVDTYAQCKTCFAKTDVYEAPYSAHLEAVEMWNTRTLDPSLATVTKLLEAIIESDKTYYNHHEPRPDGKLPKESGGTIWYTPKQLARRAIKFLKMKGDSNPC